MSEEQPKPKKTSANKAFWKAHRTNKRKSLYAAQFGLTDRNKKRKLRRHISVNPEDLKAIKRYEVNMGKATDIALRSKGRKLAARLAKSTPAPQVAE